MPQRDRSGGRSGSQRLVMDSTASWDADECIDDLITARCTDVPALLQAAGVSLYLLIDPFLGDPVLPAPLEAGLSTGALNAQRTEAWLRPTFALNLPKGLAMDAALAPYLVALQGPEDPWMDASVQWAVQETVHTWQADAHQSVPHRVGGWLQSAALGPQLAAHLTEWLRLRTQQPTSAHYLRLADRRVWSLAVHVLGESTMAASLPPVQHWHWLDAHAAWRTLSAELATHLSDDAERHLPSSTFPVFDAKQWAVMAQGPDIHHHMASSIAHKLGHSDRAAPTQWLPVNTAQWQAALLSSKATAPDRRPHP